MADDELVTLLKTDRDAFSRRRQENPLFRPNLREADLFKADLRGANLRGADLREADLSGANLSEVNLSRGNLREANLFAVNLSGADLSEADLSEADLSEADLRGADLREASFRRAELEAASLIGADLTLTNLVQTNLTRADLSEADLRGADLSEANLYKADLRGADLRGADLREANLREANLSGADLSYADLTLTNLVQTNLTRADLTNCRIYGVSAWGVKLEEAKQQNLVITTDSEPEITVDNIEVAQFIYLLLHNEKIRDAIDTIGKKGVLLLGRFTGGRIVVLERLRDELRKRGYLPMVFNFDRPETKDFTETVRILAGLSRFIIADITAPRSTPLEAQAVVPEYMIPFVPIIAQGEEPFAMFKDLWVKHDLWVLKPISYTSVEELVQGLDKGIIEPALVKFDALMKKKAEELPVTPMAEIISGAAQRSP